MIYKENKNYKYTKIRNLTKTMKYLYAEDYLYFSLNGIMKTQANETVVPVYKVTEMHKDFRVLQIDLGNQCNLIKITFFFFGGT